MFEDVKYLRCGKFISHGEWKHPDRVINSYEIIFVIEGIVFINENDKSYVLKKNDVILLEPNLRHFGFKSSENVSFYWLHFVCDTKPTVPKTMHFENPYNLSLLFKQLLHYSTEQSFMVRLDYFTRIILAEITENKSGQKENRLINNVSEWIKANKDIPFKVSDISEHFGYNIDYLSRLFKKNFGKGLKEYIDQIKIQNIKNDLLNTSLSLKEISVSCGFSDYKYFIKFFKYHEKLTPTEFRNAYAKTHINTK